ncbi:hypothetical protein [uncultured Lactobacillus sp.]|uniref:hypothetical protein n=1 Tax=uncultured Lactobacillus sp. TaxID=153152 RepID=UPI0025F5A514|nr:hypothetical protein [uncultured Lactobacillus sp.]
MNRMYFFSGKKMLAAGALALALTASAAQTSQFKALLPGNGEAKAFYVPTDAECRYVIKSQADIDKFFSQNVFVRDSLLEFKFENSTPIKFPKDADLKLMRGVKFDFTGKSTGNIDFNGTKMMINRRYGTKKKIDWNADWPETVRTSWTVKGDHKNQVISNLNVYGSVQGSVNSQGVVSSDYNGGLQVSMLHTKNVTFKNMNFHQVHYYNRHVFDVMGCTNITWDGCRFYGYAGSGFNQAGWNAIYTKNKDPHGVYSEAIELGVATKADAGGDPNVNESIFGKNMYDGAGTQNATIKNCYFGPEKNGLTGGAMINGLDKRASFPYGASVGNHSIDETSKKSHYKNISVTGTTFENTAVATNTTPTYYKHMAPVHYRYSPLDTAAQVNTLTASNNTYINVLDLGDSGIPDTLSGQNRPVYKLDLGLHKAWFRNAPVYLATISNNFAKLNSHGSKYTKAVLASSVKKTTAKKTAKKKVAKKSTKKAAKKKVAKKSTKKATKKAAKKKVAKKAAAKKTTKKKAAKKTTAKKSTKKTAAKKASSKKVSSKKKTAKKASSKKVTSKKKTAKKTTKKSSKKKSSKKKSTKKKTAKKSSKKSTKKTSKKK